MNILKEGLGTGHFSLNVKGRRKGSISYWSISYLIILVLTGTNPGWNKSWSIHVRNGSRRFILALTDHSTALEMVTLTPENPTRHYLIHSKLSATQIFQNFDWWSFQSSISMFHTQSPTQSPTENLILVVVNVHQISALIKAPYTIHGAKNDFLMFNENTLVIMWCPL